jgi:hypothetical protein
MGEKTEGQGMRPSGWIFLILSWGFITSLVLFCFWKIFSEK